MSEPGEPPAGPAPGNRLIVALDVESRAEALVLASKVGDAAGWFKVGLELFCAAGPEVVGSVHAHGRVMLDLKLHDIPQTVARATARVAGLGAELLTIHTAGGPRMMAAAARAAAGTTCGLLGVTVLTSMDAAELAAVGDGDDVVALVVRRARAAQEAGLAGVVASPQEAAAVRAACGPGFLIITPGVRPAGAAPGDQARVATPASARAAGADRIVVGRPIRDAADPRAAALAIAKELA
jgi:orotidine-5'-phosphate decarboxylase